MLGKKCRAVRRGRGWCRSVGTHAVRFATDYLPHVYLHGLARCGGALGSGKQERRSSCDATHTCARVAMMNKRNSVHRGSTTHRAPLRPTILSSRLQQGMQVPALDAPRA